MSGDEEADISTLIDMHQTEREVKEHASGIQHDRQPSAPHQIVSSQTTPSTKEIREHDPHKLD